MKALPVPAETKVQSQEMMSAPGHRTHLNYLGRELQTANRSAGERGEERTQPAVPWTRRALPHGIWGCSGPLTPGSSVVGRRLDLGDLDRFIKSNISPGRPGWPSSVLPACMWMRSK